MIDKKHIILSVTNDLTYDRRMARICIALASNGYRVTLVGRRLKSSMPFQSDHFQSSRLRCFFNKGFIFYKEYNIRLFFYLLKSGFDIACACDLDTAMPVLIASKLKGRKSVYDAHEYFSEVPELTNRPFVKWVWKCIGRITIRRFNSRYTVGDVLAKLMGDVYKTNFSVIRNIAPVVHAVKPETDRFNKKIILYQGALNVGRGLLACIDAMEQLPEWSFWLAGEGDITHELKEKVKRHNLEDRVSFLGWVKPENLPQLMAKATISINLREKGSLNDFYSLPNKFFDAIHAGLPSIHMDYPEYKTIIEKYPCATLLQNVHVDHITEAVNEFGNNKEMWENMVASCYMAAKEYTWENESQKLLEIYRSL